MDKNIESEIVIIITCADNGIGFCLTKELLADHYQVVGIDLTESNFSEVRSEYPTALSIHRCDVSDEMQVRETIEQIIEKKNRIDILVNNACLALFGPFEEKQLADTRREFEVNYFGYLNMIMAVYLHMKRRLQGVIHNVSSGVGVIGFPGIYGYASTKGAIEALTRSLAIEFAPYGITVNLIHPPLTNTKSAAPLGIPVQAMDDPANVGRRLAKKIGSQKPIITPNIQTSLGLFFIRHFPEAMGRLLVSMTQRAQADGG
jgi:NAD(P)-dependent dehydrogenase (short-subunit alcohol dehydrogenase family)